MALTGPRCEEVLPVQDVDLEPDGVLVLRCAQQLQHPVPIHTGEGIRANGDRLVVSWGQG